MKTPNRERELVLLSKMAMMSDEALEKELINLEDLFLYSESLTAFCQTHQLVKRNNITNRTAALSAVFYKKELKPFHFLLCIN